jgi:hypothetical protein
MRSASAVHALEVDRMRGRHEERCPNAVSVRRSIGEKLGQYASKDRDLWPFATIVGLGALGWRTINPPSYYTCSTDRSLRILAEIENRRTHQRTFNSHEAHKKLGMKQLNQKSVHPEGIALSGGEIVRLSAVQFAWEARDSSAEERPVVVLLRQMSEVVERTAMSANYVIRPDERPDQAPSHRSQGAAAQQADMGHEREHRTFEGDDVRIVERPGAFGGQNRESAASCWVIYEVVRPKPYR